MFNGTKFCCVHLFTPFALTVCVTVLMEAACDKQEVEVPCLFLDKVVKLGRFIDSFWLLMIKLSFHPRLLDMRC